MPCCEYNKPGAVQATLLPSLWRGSDEQPAWIEQTLAHTVEGVRLLALLRVYVGEGGDAVAGVGLISVPALRSDPWRGPKVSRALCEGSARSPRDCP